MVNLMAKLRDFAWQWRATPALAFTHFQPAQLTTVGKRATLWLHDLLLDYREFEFRQSQLALLGVKGATGTQASFLNLFGGDEAKVHRLEQLVAEKVGMRRSYPVSGQTYSRKVDVTGRRASLSGFAQSASKFAYDMRLLQHLREIEEPFEEEQIGSSAMPYKRNPMRAERIDALARHLIVNSLNPALTAATQWFERTLDDSANRRIAIPEAFLAADAIALIYDNIVGGTRRPRGRDRHERAPRAAVPDDREPDDGRRGARRRPAGAARAHPHPRASDAADALKAGAAQNDLFDRIAGRSAVRHRPRIHRALAQSGQLHRPLARSRRSASSTEDVDPILHAEREQIRDEVGEVRV